MGFNPAWKCYPILLRGTDETHELQVKHTKDYTLELVIGETVIPLQKRKREFVEVYRSKATYDKPYIGNIDHVVPDGDFGTPEFSDSGSLSDEIAFTKATIHYLDARMPSYVISYTEGAVSGSGSGNDYACGEYLINPIRALVGPFDLKAVVPITIDWTASSTDYTQVSIGPAGTGVQERIQGLTTNMDDPKYRMGVTGGGVMTIGHFALSWGDFDVVDTSQPYTREVFSGKYHIPLKEEMRLDYYNGDWQKFWDAVDRDHFSEFKARWGYFGSEGATSEIGVLLPKSSATTPIGSWPMAADGNVFISMNAEGKTFNTLYAKDDQKRTEPSTVIDTAADVYFPVGV